MLPYHLEHKTIELGLCMYIGTTLDFTNTCQKLWNSKLSKIQYNLEHHSFKEFNSFGFQVLNALLEKKHQ